MRDDAEHTARQRVDGRDGVSGRARHGARTRYADEPHLENSGLDTPRLYGSPGAVEPATEVLTRSREGAGDVRDALARNAGDDCDPAHGAVRAPLLGDQRARDVLSDGKCGTAEGEEEREQRDRGARGDRNSMRTLHRCGPPSLGDGRTV